MEDFFDLLSQKLLDFRGKSLFKSLTPWSTWPCWRVSSYNQWCVNWTFITLAFKGVLFPDNCSFHGERSFFDNELPGRSVRLAFCWCYDCGWFFFKPYHPSMASFLLVMSKSYIQNQEATFHLESWLFKVRGILNFMAYERIPSMDVPES